MTFDEILTRERHRKYVGPYCSIYVAGASPEGWAPLVTEKRNSSASQIARPSGPSWAFGAQDSNSSGEFWLSANETAIRKVKSAEILCNPRIIVNKYDSKIPMKRKSNICRFRTHDSKDSNSECPKVHATSSHQPSLDIPSEWSRQSSSVTGGGSVMNRSSFECHLPPMSDENLLLSFETPTGKEPKIHSTFVTQLLWALLLLFNSLTVIYYTQITMHNQFHQLVFRSCMALIVTILVMVMYGNSFLSRETMWPVCAASFLFLMVFGPNFPSNKDFFYRFLSQTLPLISFCILNKKSWDIIKDRKTIKKSFTQQNWVVDLLVIFSNWNSQKITRVKNYVKNRVRKITKNQGRAQKLKMRGNFPPPIYKTTI